MQPTQDVLTVTRRPLDVEDYIDIARRHKSWIIGPTFAGLVAAVVIAFLWPNTYVSEAVIQVLPPEVPERYVSSNINSELTQRINGMAQEIIHSRASLQNLITTYDLYKNDRDAQPLEDVIEKMRKNIGLSPVSSVQIQRERAPISAFRVSFKYSDRRKAQAVTKDLAAKFIEQNAASLQRQSSATTDFLHDQWEAAKARMDELDRKITEFRIRNAGRLPDQFGANLQTVQSLQAQLNGINDQVSRAGQEKLLLENQRRIYIEQLRNVANSGDTLQTMVKSQRLEQLEREIVTLEAYVSGLREKYSDEHPDVKSAQAQLATLRGRRDAMLKEESDREQQARAQAKPAPPTPAQRQSTQQLEATIAQLESQIQARNMEIEERQKQQAALTAQINQYNARIQATPLTEGEWAKLNTDYKLASERYQDLNTKLSMSQTASSLERRGQGERLALLDPASLPESPTEPDRLFIVGAGLGIGLLLGVFTAGAREMKDTSLKNLKDARAYTGLPVLGTIPLLENDLVVRRKKRLAWLAWSTACILGVLAMTGSIYYYYATRV